MSDLIFNSFTRDIMNGNIDLDSHSLKVMLLSSAYTPNAAHAVKADLSGEIAGTGYTAGGKALTSVTVGNSGGTTTFDAADVAWTGASFTARYAVIYDDTPTSPADPLICLIDFGGDKTVSNGTFTIQFNAAGIITLT
ncbi:MAG: hypothetical protein V1797_09650 [Pseudomonadota bacterium]